AQVLGRQRLAVLVVAVPPEVLERVLEHRRVVVVRAEDERARRLEQGPEGLRHEVERFGVGEVVARQQHQVRVERGQRRHPVRRPHLPGRHVEVGDVQDPDRVGLRRQHRHREVAERVLDALIEGRVRERQRARADSDAGCCGKATADLHTPTVDCRDMSELKTQLETDMRTALKARDKVTLGTLRMILAAIRNEEVAGRSPRELDDAEIVKVLVKQAKQRREAAEAFREGGREESAEAELAEEAVIKRYLPEELTEAELTALVRATIDEGGFSGP